MRPLVVFIPYVSYVILSTLTLVFTVSPSYSKGLHVNKLPALLANSHIYEKYDTVPSIDGFNFFVSNNGSDTNDGRSPVTPKLNINSIEPLMAGLTTTPLPTPSLNLEKNSVFREQFDPVNKNLQVGSFGAGNMKRLAKITGMDIVRDWTPTLGTNNVFQYQLRHSIDLGGPSYNYVMVAEIDTVLERTHPISAVKYLALVSNVANCSNISGSYYTPDITSTSATLYIHPSEGKPGNNKFRYEVTTRNYNINGSNVDNNIYNNLFLQTSGNGYGMLSGGNNTLIKNSILQGGGTHHTVIKSGQIDSCLFLPGPKGLKDGIAAVFYKAEGKGGVNKISNTIFLDALNAVYTHTNGVVNHSSLTLDKVYAFGDTTAALNGLSSYDTDSVDVSHCYVEGYPNGWYGGGTKLNIKNSIFRNTSQSAILILSKADVTAQVTIKDVLIKTNGNDNNQNLANGWTAYGVRSIYNNVNVELSNSIIHAYSTWHGPYQTVTTLQAAGHLTAHNNIYICDVNDNNSVYMNIANNNGGRGTSTNISSDYNAFILLRGSKFNWMASPNNNGESSLSTLPEWQSLTGQDKNSIIIDLRNHPLGLKAIFVDPDNGNWTLAQTLQADSIRKLSAGITNPPLFYPRRPSIENDGIPFKSPGGLSTFAGSLKSEEESVVQWRTFNESAFSSFIIEYSLDGINFMEAGSLKVINDNQNNNYQFVHTHSAIDSIFYRIRCLNTDSTSFFSSRILLYSDFSREFKLTVYPNPFRHSLTVQHPRRNKGEIRIYNFEGRILKVVPVTARTSKTVLNLSSLPSARYFIQWSSDKEMLSGTVIK